MKPKEILVFGATGQIGRHLIRKLTKNNYKVVAVTRNIHKKGFGTAGRVCKHRHRYWYWY